MYSNITSMGGWWVLPCYLGDFTWPLSIDHPEDKATCRKDNRSINASWWWPIKLPSTVRHDEHVAETQQSSAWNWKGSKPRRVKGGGSFKVSMTQLTPLSPLPQSLSQLTISLSKTRYVRSHTARWSSIMYRSWPDWQTEKRRRQ